MVTSHAPPTVAVHQDASEGIDGKGNNPGETSEAAKQGRSFDVKVSPRETWDAVFETVMGELRAEGHENLLVNLKKKVSLKRVSISISYDRVLVAVLCVKFGQNSTCLTPGKHAIPWAYLMCHGNQLSLMKAGPPRFCLAADDRQKSIQAL